VSSYWLLIFNRNKFGRDLAIVFVQKGYIVFADVRKDVDGESIKAEHKNIIPVKFDVTIQEQVDSSRDFVRDYLKKNNLKLVGLINNAGISFKAPWEFVPMKELRYVMEVNYFGVISVTQAFLPFIRESTGRIINIGSLLGEVSIPFSGGYSASKYALRSFSDGLRRELNPWDIYVGLVEPSYVTTAMGERTSDLTDTIYSNIPEEGKKY